MAAATFLDGPYAKGFDGRIEGMRSMCQWGRAAFPTTDLTCTIPLRSAGLTGTPLVFLQHSVVDKTLVPSISGTTLTVTRTENSDSPEFSYLIIYSS